MAQSVILLSKDGLEVPVDMSVAELSSVLKAKLASISDPAGKWVLLDNIRGEVLQKIVEWMNQHCSDPVPGNKMESGKIMSLSTDDFEEWDKMFLNVPVSTLIGLMFGASYLDIEGLVDACCKKIADNFVNNRPIEEIQQFLEQ